MRTSNRVCKKASPAQPELQSKTRTKTESETGREARDAFIELDNAGCAAIALAQLNASYIRICIHDFAAWQDFNSACFKAGTGVLPRLLAAEFEREFHTWDESMNRAIELLNGPKPSNARGAIVTHEVENVVSALVHLLDLQGQEISRRNDDSSFASSFIVMERLESAFNKASEAYCKLIYRLVQENAGTILRAAVKPNAPAGRAGRHKVKDP